MSIFLYELGVFPVILAFGETCSAPNPTQWLLIISLISASGLLAVASGAAVVAVASTIIPMIIAGASITEIVGAITGHVALSAGGLEILSGLVIAIKNIVGC